MFVTSLELVDFRSYPAAQIDLDAGVTVFLGSNGQGKTNLVEAVEYLATLGSHRVASDAPLIRLGAQQAIVRAGVQAGPEDTRSLLLEVEINQGRANRCRINRSALRRNADFVGALRVVLFSPEDLAIVKGDPSDRRRFLTELMVARWPRLIGVMADYEHLLRQRNALLKTLSGRNGQPEDSDSLEIWNEHLAQVGSEVLEARLDTLAALLPYATQAYASIAPVNNEISGSYKTSLQLPPGALEGAPDRAELAQALRDAMQQRRDAELARGISLVGPQRDDVTLGIGELPAKGYASHGESWSLALALRLGALSLLQADGVEPVLILDDVFAELDTIRCERLAQAAIAAEQVLVTTAVASDVPEMLQGRRFKVAGGNVSPMSAQEVTDD